MSSDLESRLRLVLDERATEIQPEPMPAGLTRRVRRRRAVRAAAAGGGVFAVVGAAMIALSSLVPLAGSGEQVASNSYRWTSSVGKLPAAPLTARRDTVGVWTGSEMLVWGGFSGDQASETFYADGAAYNPDTNRWRTLAAAPLSARAKAQAAWTGTEMIVWGGTDARHSERGVTDGAAYNPRTNTWRRIASTPGDGRSGGQALMADGKLVIFGGTSASGSYAAKTTLIYDPAGNRWATVSTLGRVVAAATTGSTLTLAQYDDNGRVSVHQVGTDGAALTRGPVPAVDEPADRVGLTATEDAVYLVVTEQTQQTRIFAAAGTGGVLSGGAWTEATTSDTVSAPNQISTGYTGLTVALSPSAVLMAGLPNITVLDPRTGKVLLTESTFKGAGICGISGAVVWTGEHLLSWGGQTCQPDGPAVTSEGVRWTPRS